jgi:hypothetical protein
MTSELHPLEDGAQRLDAPLQAELPTFELFFKTFGFKRLHGRIWGLLVLSGKALSSREICDALGISQGASSTTLNELAEWGAIASEFDSSRRCHLHSPVGNALSIVATVFRRREQVALQQFQQTATRSLEYVTERYGPRDPRVFTLRSILTTCEIADAMMKLVLSAVSSALGDPQSILSRAVNAALKVGVGVPARLFLSHEYDTRRAGAAMRAELEQMEEARSEETGAAARGDA